MLSLYLLSLALALSIHNKLHHAVDTSGRICDDFSRLLFLHAHREASALANELQEESEQFRFLRAACYGNIKGSVGLILAKASAMRISIPLDLSSRPFIPLPRFMRSRRKKIENFFCGSPDAPRGSGDLPVCRIVS